MPPRDAVAASLTSMPRDSEYGKLLGTQSTSVQSVTKAQHGTWNRHAPCAEFLASFLVLTGCKRVDLRHIALVGLARLGPQVRLRADQAAERHCKHERAARPSRSHRMHPCDVSVSACRPNPTSRPTATCRCNVQLAAHKHRWPGGRQRDEVGVAIVCLRAAQRQSKPFSPSR